MKQFQKQFGCKAVSVAGSEVTPEMLAKINSFALNSLTVEQVYVRKFLFCHSAIDRDVERFPKALLEDFAATFPGKSFLFNHERRSSPFGLFFDAITEDMSPEQFKTLTSVEPNLPESEKSITVVWAWSYMLNEEFNSQITKNLDAGIYRHVSIGFSATDLTAVKKEINGPTLYWEYVAPGEALEGSLVWLGAQPGATAQKNLKDQDNHKQEVVSMKTIIALLVGLGFKTLTETATEDQIASGIKSLMDEKAARIKALEKDAEEGKAYRDDMVKTYVASKAKLGEVAETPEAQAGLKTVAAGYPLDFLKSEIKHLQTRIEKQFPAETQVKGEDGNDKRDKSASDNPLIPEEKK
jgi:hypothetical protein